MKKIVIGIIIGALLMFSGQAIADSISKVGKKVQAEYVIKVDGKKLDAKALAIDGQTTTPNRALADAVGYDVAFVNKEVIFTKRSEVQPVEETEQPVPTETPPTSIPIEEPKSEYTLESVNSLIKSIESEMRAYKLMYDDLVRDGANPEQLEKWEKYFKDKEAELVRLRAIKADLESNQ
jgi:hypothetical protein